MSAAANAWVELQCQKCGTLVRILPVDRNDQSVLRRTPFVGDDTELGEQYPACPMCMYWRGGHYWLERVPRAGEREALDAYRAACVAAATAIDPADVVGPPTPPPDDADDDAHEEYERAWDARMIEEDAYDALFTAVATTKEALEAFGYGQLELEAIDIDACDHAEFGR